MKVDKCDVSNLDGEESKMVGEDNIVAVPEAKAETMVNEVEAELEASGGAGCSHEKVVVEEVSSVDLKEEVENEPAAEGEGGDGGEYSGEMDKFKAEAEAATAVAEAEADAAEAEAAAAADEEKPAFVACSEKVVAKEDILTVDMVKSGGEKTISDVDGGQPGFFEAVITSESHGEVVEDGGLGDRETDFSEKAVRQLSIAESALVTEVERIMVAEEEASVVYANEFGKSVGENADPKAHTSAVIGKDGKIVATENDEMLPPKSEDSYTVGRESAVANRDDKMYEDMADMIPVAEVKMEAEVDAGAKVWTVRVSEGEAVCESHDSEVVDGEIPFAVKDVKDELMFLAEEKSLLDNCQMENDKSLDMEAIDVVKDEKDELKEKGLVQHETDEIRGMTEESSSTTGNKLKCEIGRETELNRTKDGELVDSQFTFVDKNGEDEEAEAEKDAGIKATRIDAETVTEVGNMEITDDGKGEEPEADEEMGIEDTRTEEETETELEKMQVINEGDNEAIDQSDGPKSTQDEEDEAMMAEEETTAVDTEVETETDAVESGKTVGEKRKRGKSKSPANSKVVAKVNKTMEEDVCFICFDGGELVLCDRRGCPKAYHPPCVNRDEAFFRSKGRWNCGWHLCSICEKNARYMCYTCTFSLCKGCIKDAVILCVRGNKGFCETCIKTVMLIESNEQGYKDDQVNFDDRSSWEYLFKDYYMDLKSKLSLSSLELAEAKNPWKGSDASAGKHNKVPARGVQEKASAGKQEKSPELLPDTNDDGDAGVDADTSNENVGAHKSKRRKVKKQSKTLSKHESFSDGDNSNPGDSEWASKELLEFVMHMKDGGRSPLSQYDVQALLLEYIKRNNLRDPRQKSRIICDLRLQNLFGKPRVGHFEMLKLLESHFLVKGYSQPDDVNVNVVDTEIDKAEVDTNADTLTKGVKDKKRKTRKKSDRRGPQCNLDDYAAVDIHNIGLIYLRRKLMEDLLEDIDSFKDKVVGTFVRIRISGSVQKQDIYRLVQVVGISKAAEPYKVGKRTTDITVEILNLNKTEVISIDTISNQDFTEDECKRLRQSIKCGLISRLTLGDILDKAMELQTTRVNDWMESEIMRLSHLRDRASEKGRRKELRECVEKLQLLKTPEERQRRLEEVPEIHVDPRMDPGYQSEEDGSEADDKRLEVNTKIRGSGSRGQGQVSPGSDLFPKDSWSGGGKYPSNNWDLERNLSSKNILLKGGDSNIHIGDALSENSWNQGRERGAHGLSNLEKFGSAVNFDTVGWNSQDLSKSDLFTSVSSVALPSPCVAKAVENAIKINESEKMWHYQDPSGKVQGPFSMVQLRKWSNTGYFPTDLRIWRATENKDDSILLTDALAGKFQKEPVAMASTISDNPVNNVMTSMEQTKEGQDGEKSKVDKTNAAGNLVSHLGLPRGQAAPAVELPEIIKNWSQSDLPSLPSPTPKTRTSGWTGEGGSVTTTASTPQSLAAVLPEHTTQSSMPASVLNSGTTLRGGESDSSDSGAGLGAVLTSNQGGLMVSTNTLQSSVSVVTGDAHAVQMHSHVAVPQEIAAPRVQPVSSQNLIVETPSWGNAQPQKLEPHPHVPVPVEQQIYGQWGVNPGNFQTHAGNFPGSGTSHQSDLWRPAQSSQPNLQLPSMPNMPWAVGMAGHNTPASVSRPENSNFGWSVVQGNPNMCWVGAAPINANMNWGATVQGPTSGIAVSPWTMPPGNPGAPVQGQVPTNAHSGWVAGAGNHAVQGMAPGSANQGWIPPTGTTAPALHAPAPGNGWTPSVGNPGASIQGLVSGNSNQGWGAPASNQGPQGSEQNNRGKLSGQGENGSRSGGSGFGSGRSWNRQSSFGNGRPGGGSSRHPGRRQTPCPYNKNGQCRKGASCDYLHT